MSRFGEMACRPIGRFLFLMAMTFVLAVPMIASSRMTIVKDVYYKADGTPAQGTLLITWPAFTASSGESIVAGSKSVTLSVDGSLNISLVPNTNSSPASFYKVLVRLNDGTTNTEFWTVPIVEETTIGAIRAEVVPLSVAQQFVSRDYLESQKYVQLEGLRTTDQFVAVQPAVTGAGSKGAIAISPGFAGDDTFTNPNDRPVFDMRSMLSMYAGTVTPEMWGARRDGATNDLAAIQKCIDYSSENGGRCRLLGGVYYVDGNSDGLVLRPHTQLEGNGIDVLTTTTPYKGTKIVCGSGISKCMTIVPGPVQHMSIGGFMLWGDGATSTQQGIYFEARDGVVPSLSYNWGQGGIWYSDFHDIWVQNFLGEGIWFKGGNTDTQFPHQFNTFERVHSEPNVAGAKEALVLTGQFAQATFLNCTFSIRADLHLARAVWIGYDYKDGFAASNNTPGNVTFIGATIQSSTIGAELQYTDEVTFREGWFEEVALPILSNFATSTHVENNHIANSCTTTCLDVSGGTDHGSTFSGNYIVNNQYSVGAMVTGHNVAIHDNATNNGSGWVSSGATLQSDVATSFLADSHTMLVNGDGGAVPLMTIVSAFGPGENVTLVAWSNSFTIAEGGNILLGQFGSPLIVPKGAQVTLTRIDLGGAWIVVGAGGQQKLGRITFDEEPASKQAHAQWARGSMYGPCLAQYPYTGSTGLFWGGWTCFEYNATPMWLWKYSGAVAGDGTDSSSAVASLDSTGNFTANGYVSGATVKVNGNILSATAGTSTLTLPAATDILVGRTTTDTLTNKTLTSPTLTNPMVDIGVAQGAGAKHARVTMDAVAASSSMLVSLPWSGMAFADTNYTLVCDVEQSDTATTTLSIDHIASKTTSSVAVIVKNNSTTTANTGTLGCIALHD